MHLNLRKNGYLMKISQENFCILTRFFLIQNNRNLVAANSTVTTQSIHASPLSQTISFDGTSQCFPSLHTSALTDFSLTSNAGSVDVQLSTRLLQSDILCTITTCNVRNVWLFILNPSVYMCCTNIFIKHN